MGRPHKAGVVIIGACKISVPLELWKLIGSPLYMIKDRHLPTGELHLVPASEQDQASRTVEVIMRPSTRRRVRLSLSAVEIRSVIPGEYQAEVAVVLQRPVIILKGVLK